MTTPWSNVESTVAPFVDKSMEAGNVAWKVKTVPVLYLAPNEDGSDYELREYGARNLVVRTDTYEVVGEGAQDTAIIQNEQAFQIIKELAEFADLNVVGCGPMHGGRIVWMLAEFTTDWIDLGPERIHKAVLVTRSHDGEFGHQMFPCLICRKQDVVIKFHDASTRITKRRGDKTHFEVNAEKAVDILSDQFDIIESNLEKLSTLDVQRDAVLGMIRALTEAESDRKALREFYDGPDKETEVGPSAWRALLTAAHYTNHLSKVRARNAESTDEARLCSLWFHTGNQKLNKALSTVLSWAERA